MVMTWEHGVAKIETFQNLGCQVLTIMFISVVHVFEGQVMKCSILDKHLVLKLFTQKSSKTWKTKSWIAQWLSRLGDMELQICQENKFNCVHVLEDQVMKGQNNMIQPSSEPCFNYHESIILERPGRWSQLRQAWVVGLGFKPWTFQELTCITLGTTLKSQWSCLLVQDLRGQVMKCI